MYIGSDIINNIKAILFDSGRVLNGPSTGNWFISPDFFKYVDEKKFKKISCFKRKRAFAKAYEYISKQRLIKNEKEEYIHFIEFYTILFSQMPELELDEEDVKGAAHDYVYNYDKYKFYDDVKEVIPKLSPNYKLAVVSDAWPSLENIFKKANLRDYFSSFVISSVKGTTKPDRLMYETALNELNVDAKDALFIDDNPKNCDGAEKLGIKTIVLNRDIEMHIINRLRGTKQKIISDLHELTNAISKM